jgi:hypothetical protein
VSAAAWIAARGAGVPAALSDRLRQVAGRHDDLVEAAEATLRQSLATQPMTRAHALDLLTADALATYVFESAADDPSTLSARADDAMCRFGALGRDT